jgi:pyrrolidone-carboxylate peptidase
MISGFIHVPLDMSQCVSGRGRALSRYFLETSVTARGLEAALTAVAAYFTEGI